jgi:PilZ domain
VTTEILPETRETADRSDKRIHVAFPIKITYSDDEGKPRFEMACTYDISTHGARVTGLRCVKEAGEIVVVERGRNKAYCRVVWIGEAGSALSQQVGIQCVEAQKTLWDAELRDMQEIYDPILVGTGVFRAPATHGAGRNRRKFQRFDAQGAAQLLRKSADGSYLEGRVKDLSEVGCLISTNALLIPGTDLKLLLRLKNYDLSFKGSVRHAALDIGLGIEFQEVRKGDRAVLRHILQKLAEKQPAPAAERARAATRR